MREVPSKKASGENITRGSIPVTIKDTDGVNLFWIVSDCSSMTGRLVLLCTCSVYTISCRKDVDRKSCKRCGNACEKSPMRSFMPNGSLI